MAKKIGQNSILQFDPLKHSTIKLSCKLTYTPQKSLPHLEGFLRCVRDSNP